METGTSEQEVRENVCKILEEMSQNLQLPFIRLMAYTFAKVFKKLFSAVLVNMEGLSVVSSTQEQLTEQLLSIQHTVVLGKKLQLCIFGHKFVVNRTQ